MAHNPLPKPSITAVLEELGGRAIGPDRGGWQKATCPIHEDKSPSASLNEDACRFHCFVCDFSGDAIDLLMECLNVGFNAAIQRAKELAGEGGGEVRSDSGRSGLLPGGKRHKQGGSVRAAPWMRL